MTDEQRQPGSDQVDDDPVAAAYEQALAGGSDRYGLPPAHEVTSIKGVPAEHAEQAARRELEQIQKLRGTSEQRVADPDQQPEQPTQEQAAEAPQPGQLSREQVAERLLYGPEQPRPQEQLTPEQAAAIEAMQNERAFHSGEAAQMAVEAEGEYERAHADLLELPGITTDAFTEYAEAPHARMVDAYELEPESVASLNVLRQLYEQSGGAGRWSGEAEAQQQEQAYEKVLSGGGPRDSYGFPTEDRDE